MNMYYENPDKNVGSSTPKCVDCMDNYKTVGGKCIKHDAPRVECKLGTATIVPPKYEGCSKCVDVSNNELLCVECKSGYVYDEWMGSCTKHD